MAKYEIKTMKEDIEELRKKTGGKLPVLKKPEPVRVRGKIKKSAFRPGIVILIIIVILMILIAIFNLLPFLTKFFKRVL